MSTIINKIWNIRGEISQAILNKDTNKFEQAKKQFYKILEKEEHLKTFSTITIFAEFESVEALNMDRETNFAMIAYDFTTLKSALNGALVVHNKEFYSVLEAIWIVRDIFDSLVKGINENKFTQQQIVETAKGIYVAFYKMIEFYECLSDEYALVELESIYDVFDEVKAELCSYYDESNIVPEITIYGEC